MKTKANYKFDEQLAKKALAKALNRNVANNVSELVNFMLVSVCVHGFKLELNPQTFDWVENKKSSMLLNAEYTLELCSFLQRRGLRHDYSFMINVLLLNFLNKF